MYLVSAWIYCAFIGTWRSTQLSHHQLVKQRAWWSTCLFWRQKELSVGNPETYQTWITAGKISTYITMSHARQRRAQVQKGLTFRQATICIKLPMSGEYLRLSWATTGVQAARAGWISVYILHIQYAEQSQHFTVTNPQRFANLFFSWCWWTIEDKLFHVSNIVAQFCKDHRHAHTQLSFHKFFPMAQWNRLLKKKNKPGETFPVTCWQWIMLGHGLRINNVSPETTSGCLCNDLKSISTLPKLLRSPQNRTGIFEPRDITVIYDGCPNDIRPMVYRAYTDI